MFDGGRGRQKSCNSVVSKAALAKLHSLTSLYANGRRHFANERSLACPKMVEKATEPSVALWLELANGDHRMVVVGILTILFTRKLVVSICTFPTTNTLQSKITTVPVFQFATSSYGKGRQTETTGQ